MIDINKIQERLQFLALNRSFLLRALSNLQKYVQVDKDLESKIEELKVQDYNSIIRKAKTTDSIFAAIRREEQKLEEVYLLFNSYVHDLMNKNSLPSGAVTNIFEISVEDAKDLLKSASEIYIDESVKKSVFNKRTRRR